MSSSMQTFTHSVLLPESATFQFSSGQPMDTAEKMGEHGNNSPEGSHPMRAEESATSTEQSPADGAKEPCQPVGTFALDALREIAARAKANG